MKVNGVKIVRINVEVEILEGEYRSGENAKYFTMPICGIK
jgi:hypothetical protein